MGDATSLHRRLFLISIALPSFLLGIVLAVLVSSVDSNNEARDADSLAWSDDVSKPSVSPIGTAIAAAPVASPGTIFVPAATSATGVPTIEIAIATRTPECINPQTQTDLNTCSRLDVMALEQRLMDLLPVLRQRFQDRDSRLRADCPDCRFEPGDDIEEIVQDLQEAMLRFCTYSHGVIVRFPDGNSLQESGSMAPLLVNSCTSSWMARMLELLQTSLGP